MQNITKIWPIFGHITLFFNISPFLMTHLLTDHSQKVSKNQGFTT